MWLYDGNDKPGVRLHQSLCIHSLQLFEESARQVRKEAIHHADHLNKALQHQLEAGLDKKADASTVGREGQSSRQQLSELWAEAESAREGLEQVKGDVQQVQGQVVGLHDKLVVTKVSCTVTFAKLAHSVLRLGTYRNYMYQEITFSLYTVAFLTDLMRPHCIQPVHLHSL